MATHSRRQTLTQARLLFNQQGAVPGGMVAEPILRSWRRCADLGFDMRGVRRAELMTQGELREAQQRNEALRPYASAVVEKDFTGDDRTVRFAQTSAPTIVNSFELEDASKKAYGRFTGGFSAAIFSTVSLEVSGSATIGKDHGNETSANVGVRIGL